MELYWSKNESDEEETNHLQKAGNIRPSKLNKPKVKGRKTKEVKAEIPIKQPIIEDLSPKKDTMVDEGEQNKVRSSRGKAAASLKDLCPEDKQRIANLIKELARVGEEKETATSQLQRERTKFEEQILQLVDQQEKILYEREAVQTQLMECQGLLAKYQQHILDQQEKLSQSISEATPKREGMRRKKSSRSRSSGTPTRESYSQEFIKEKFEAGPLQTSNYRPAEEVLNQTVLDSVNNSLLSQQSAQSQQPKDAVSERPFTNMIDQLIAQEKNQVPAVIPSAHIPAQNANVAPQVPSHLQSVGLLIPALSSTQRSEYNVSMGQTFQPLQPDPSLMSSHGAVQQYSQPFQPFQGSSGAYPVQPESAAHASRTRMQELPAQSSGRPAQVSFESPVYQDIPSDTSQPVGVQERPPVRRDLQAQKDLLLAEQERLKEILRQQEALLRAKQEQLMLQQMHHQARLDFFARKGHFPSDTSTSSAPLEHGLRPPGLEAIPHVTESLKPASTISNDGSFIDEARMRINQVPLGVGVSSSENVNGVKKGLPKPVFVGNQVETKSAGTSPITTLRTKTSIATSPHQPKGSRPLPLTDLHNLNITSSSTDSTLDAFRPQGTAPSKTSRQGNLPSYLHQHGPRGSSVSSQASVSSTPVGEHAARLLELVQQVDSRDQSQSSSLLSSQSSRHPSSSNGLRSVLKRTAPAPNTQEAGEDEEEEDQEESQLLEDVFFIR